MWIRINENLELNLDSIVSTMILFDELTNKTRYFICDRINPKISIETVKNEIGEEIKVLVVKESLEVEKYHFNFIRKKIAQTKVVLNVS